MKKRGADIVIAILLITLVIVFFWGGKTRDNYTKEERRSDSIAGQLAAKQLEVEGWTTRFGRLEEELEATVASKDEELAQLVEQIEAARGDLIVVNRMLAQLRGQVADTVFVETPVQCTGLYRGQYNDGLLFGNWMTVIRPSQAEMRLDYTARVGIELYQSQMNDGRWLVAARTSDDRVDIGDVRTIFDPPPPEVHYKMPKKKAALIAVLGITLGALLGG